MKRLLIVAAMVAVIMFASMASFKTSKASADTSSPASTAVTVVSVSSTTGNIPSPSINAAIQYAFFPPNLGPYCVSGYAPNGGLIIINGATSVQLRFNSARQGWDQMVVDNVVYSINPGKNSKLLTGNCLIVP